MNSKIGTPCIPLLLLLAAFLSGCSQRDIIHYGNETADISVIFNWESAAGANVDGMTIYFYPLTDYGRIWKFDIAGKDGGKVRLPMGSYSMVAFNNDLPGIYVSDEDSYHTLSATARTSGDSGLLLPTGMLYGASVARVDLSPCGVSYTSPSGACKECPYGVVRCVPDSLATVFSIHLTDLRGADNYRKISAGINGIGKSCMIADAKVEGAGVSSPVALSASNDGPGNLSGLTTAFCNPEHGYGNLSLNIIATHKNGKTFSKIVDLNERNINRITDNYVIIKEDGLTLPSDEQPGDSDIGISVGVDGWTTYDITYDTSVP